MLYYDKMNKSSSLEKKSKDSRSEDETSNKCFTLKISEKQNAISLLNKMEYCREVMTKKEMIEALNKLSFIDSDDNEEANLLFEILRDKKNLIKKEHLSLALIVILKINYPIIKLGNDDSKLPQING